MNRKIIREPEIEIKSHDIPQDSNSLKDRIEKMGKEELKQIVMGDELFPDKKILWSDHKLANKEPQCGKCQKIKDPTFRCGDHKRKCVCGLQFENPEQWKNHREKWTFKLREFNLKKPMLFNPETPFEELKRLAKTSFNMQNALRFNGHVWKHRFWHFLCSKELEEIKRILIYCSTFENITLFQIHKNITNGTFQTLYGTGNRNSENSSNNVTTTTKTTETNRSLSLESGQNKPEGLRTDWPSLNNNTQERGQRRHRTEDLSDQMNKKLKETETVKEPSETIVCDSPSHMNKDSADSGFQQGLFGEDVDFMTTDQFGPSSPESEYGETQIDHSLINQININKEILETNVPTESISLNEEINIHSTESEGASYLHQPEVSQTETDLSLNQINQNKEITETTVTSDQGSLMNEEIDIHPIESEGASYLGPGVSQTETEIICSNQLNKNREIKEPTVTSEQGSENEEIDIHSIESETASYLQPDVSQTGTEIICSNQFNKNKEITERTVTSEQGCLMNKETDIESIVSETASYLPTDVSQTETEIESSNQVNKNKEITETTVTSEQRPLNEEIEIHSKESEAPSSLLQSKLPQTETEKPLLIRINKELLERKEKMEPRVSTKQTGTSTNQLSSEKKAIQRSHSMVGAINSERSLPHQQTVGGGPDSFAVSSKKKTWRESAMKEISKFLDIPYWVIQVFSKHEDVHSILQDYQVNQGYLMYTEGKDHKYYAIIAYSNPNEMVWTLHCLEAETDCRIESWDMIREEKNLYVHPSHLKDPLKIPTPRNQERYEKWPTTLKDDKSCYELEQRIIRVRDDLKRWVMWTVTTSEECEEGVPREVFKKWGAIVGRNMFDKDRNFQRSGFVIFSYPIPRPQPKYIINFKDCVYEFNCMSFNSHPTFREKMGFKPWKRR